MIRSCNGYGLEALAIRLNAQKWTEVITVGLASKQLQLP